MTSPMPDTETSLQRACRPCRLEDCSKYMLKDSKWVVQGHSFAAERTGYWLQGPNVVVDCGLSTYRTPNAVFLTHRHTDHSAEIPNMISCRSLPRKGQEALIGRPIVMPHECVPMVAHLCASFAYLSDGVLPASPEVALKRIGVHPIPAAHGECITVPGVDGVVIEVLAAHHGETESNGYGFSEVRMKLKDEYKELPGAEIANLRKNGADVTQRVVTPIVAIFGDTTPDALLFHEEWKKYPNVFIECTATEPSTDPRKIASRREHGHSHISELLPILEKFQNGRRWFIQHTTLATKREAVLKTLALSTLTDFVLVGDDISD